MAIWLSVRRAILVMGAVLVVTTLGISPASASTTPRPAPPPMAGKSELGFGIYSERHRLTETSLHTASSASPSAPLVTCTAGWRAVQSQNGSWNNSIGGVTAITPIDIWAVGNSQSPTPTTYANGEQNLAEHWDGMSWTTFTTPQPGPDANLLNDVSAFATNDVWAVGVANTTGHSSSTALHFDGTSWTGGIVNSSSSDNVLSDVKAFANNNVWAVGEIKNAGVNQTLIMQWNGTSWSTVASPNVGTGNNALYGIGGTGPSDIWAVGYSRSTASSPRQSLIEHYDGTSWSVYPSPNYFSGDNTLLSVDADSTTSAWAVGYATGGNSQPVGIATHLAGTSWGADQAINGPSLFTNTLVDVVNVPGSSNYWLVGFYATGAATQGPMAPFTAHNSGSGWNFLSATSNGNGDNAFFSVAAPLDNDVWAGGLYASPTNLSQTLIENYSGLQAPAITGVTPGDQSAQVTWSLPCSDGGSPITKYIVTAYDGCTIQGSEAATGASTTTLNYTGLTNGTAFTFTVAAYNGFGLGPQSASSATVTPSGATVPSWITACSTQQYQLTNSDGTTWHTVDATNLSLSFTPSVDSVAMLSANADMWTMNAGYNQDLGIALTGSPYPTLAGDPEAWKESGGWAGTFSPNAAYVQTAIPVTHGVAYTAKLVWKANTFDSGTIFMGAGPIPPSTSYSPTRLSVRLIADSSGYVSKVSTINQYSLAGSDGATWTAMDPTKLSNQFTVPASPSGNWTAFVMGNADLWTKDAGYNQDLGVSMIGSGFPTTPGQPESWKESGGFAGTFSPNAAFVTSALTLTAGQTYTALLVWKANQADPGSIFAGAGPDGANCNSGFCISNFSPTSLIVVLVPPAAGALAATTSRQYMQTNSDGSYWLPMDSSNLTINTGSLGTSTSYLVSANADLWTAIAGYNQDIGIMVSGGAYGGGTLAAWKESGGFAGTYSPNAAFVSTVLHLQSGNTYTISVVWKTNSITKGSTPVSIFVGAGPVPSGSAKYSPTWLTAEPLSQP